MHPHVAQVALDRIVPHVAVAAVHLQRRVAHGKPGIGRETLGHGAVQGGLRIAPVQLAGRMVDHEAGRLQLGRHVGEAELKRLELGERLAELLA